MEGRKFSIRVLIGKVTLPMSVSSEDQEELVRKAASNVNQQLIAMREKYRDLPNENYYDAMVMLNSEIKALTAEDKVDASPIFEVLEDLGNDIDKLLNKQ